MKFGLFGFLTCIALVTMLSCNNKGSGGTKPAQIIDRETMIMLMADMDITDAALKVRQKGLSHDSINKIADQVYDSLYLYYKTTPEIFKQNIRYYQSDMADFEKMVDDKITLLSKKKDSIMLAPEKLDTTKYKVKKVILRTDSVVSKK